MMDVLREIAAVPFLIPGCVLLLVVAAFRTFLNPDPRLVLSDHVMYIHATLGMGKTALAAHWVARLLRPDRVNQVLARLFRRPAPVLPLVYSTFELKGAKPLDLRVGGWPAERGAKIVIDEVLLLESNDLIPVEWFSRGCTLARQLGQQVVIISQASRLPNRLRKFMGTFGTFITMKGVSIGALGRVVIVKRSSEPFIRQPKGYKADGMKRSFLWIPGHVFKSYNSRKIYGYTVDTDGSWIDLQTAANAAGVDNQGRGPGLSRAPGAAHVPPVPAGPGGAAHVPGARVRGRGYKPSVKGRSHRRKGEL